MLPSMRPSSSIRALVFLVLAAIASQRNVVRAQGQNTYPYYYWLSPGRIAGIAVGALAAILLVLMMLIFACRRRRHAIAESKVEVSNYSGAGGPPQSFPPWQEAQQTSYGPGASSMGWHYSAQDSAAPQRVQSTGSADKPQGVALPSAARFSETQRTPTSDQVQRPAPTSPVLSTVTTGQVERSPPPRQAQSPTFSGRAQDTLPSSPTQARRTEPPGQVQRNAPPSQVQNIAPSSRTQSTVPLIRVQEQRAAPPPPRYAHTKGTPSGGVTNGRDRSPPPYSPTGPPTPPAAHTVG